MIARPIAGGGARASGGPVPAQPPAPEGGTGIPRAGANPVPTPPELGNKPHAPLRSPLPALIADTDQIRQVYGKGVNVRRFWPLLT